DGLVELLDELLPDRLLGQRCQGVGAMFLPALCNPVVRQPLLWKRVGELLLDLLKRSHGEPLAVAKYKGRRSKYERRSSSILLSSPALRPCFSYFVFRPSTLFHDFLGLLVC